MKYQVEFWTREVNVIEVEADSVEELCEKCDELLYSPENNYIWDNAEVENGGWDVVGKVEDPEKQYEIRFIDGHDLKYKVFNTEASCPDHAINYMWDKYGSNFEHRIISVEEVTA